MNVKKIISLIMLLFMLLPLGAQNSEGKQRYKIAACDWMMLKRQKIGSFQLMKELDEDIIARLDLVQYLLPAALVDEAVWKDCVLSGLRRISRKNSWMSWRKILFFRKE